jgi:hypothetical protein
VRPPLVPPLPPPLSLFKSPPFISSSPGLGDLPRPVGTLLVHPHLSPLHDLDLDSKGQTSFFFILRNLHMHQPSTVLTVTALFLLPFLLFLFRAGKSEETLFPIYSSKLLTHMHGLLQLETLVEPGSTFPVSLLCEAIYIAIM